MSQAANYLRSRGHTVTFNCLPFRGSPNFPDLADTVPYRESLIHVIGADVVYCTYAPLVTRLFLTRAPRILGLHATLHDSLNTSITNMREFFRRYGPYVTVANIFRKHFDNFDNFEALHWVSPSRPFVRHKKIFSIPNWIDFEYFSKLPHHRNGRFKVLFVGRQSYSKGFDRFVGVSRLFRNDDIDFVSTGQSFERVRGVGWLPYEKMPTLYSDASVVISPSRDDSFGLANVEALASGIPVITSPIRGHEALELPFMYGATPHEIAQHVKTTYSSWKADESHFDELRKQCRESARKYDARNLLPQFEGMLESVANNRRQ